MRASELMMHDLVINRGSVVRVVAIDGYMDEIETEVTDKYDTGVRVKEVEPIPLTAEMLEANGFQSSNDNKSIAYFSEEDEPLFTISIRRNRYWIPVSWYGKGTSLNYVHELQHALRLCGLNELADNFKIK